MARGRLTDRIGRQLIEQFIAGYMKAELRGAPRIVHAAGHSFSDVAAKCVHIVNLASVREFERMQGRPIDPLRFRANLYIDGVAPWAEFGWLDKELQSGRRGWRCLPARSGATRPMSTRPPEPATWRSRRWLQRSVGHSDFGIYAKVVTGGEVAPGAPVVPPT